MACEEIFELLNKLGVNKEEEINISRSHIFNKFVGKAKQTGYLNINRVEIADKSRELAESIFMNLLHELGVSNKVVLEGKNYAKFHEILCDELLANPNLLQYVRPHYKLNKHFTNLVYKIDRLHNEFPNLLCQM